MIAYIVSLRDPQSASIQHLHDHLCRAGFQVMFAPGVLGSALPANDYYRMILRYHAESALVLSPGEVGCALAHCNVFRRLLESDEQHALILEDDVPMDETIASHLRLLADKHLDAVEFMLAIAAPMSRQTFPDVKGTRISNDPLVSRVNTSYLGAFYSGAGYFVSREAAAKLIAGHERGVFLPDDYVYVHREVGISHFHYAPVAFVADYGSSLLQPLRELRNPLYVRRRERELGYLVRALARELARRLGLRFLRWQRWFRRDDPPIL